MEADWYAVVRDHPEHLTSDGLHLAGEPGWHARSALYWHVLARRRPLPAPDPPRRQPRHPPRRPLPALPAAPLPALYTAPVSALPALHIAEPTAGRPVVPVSTSRDHDVVVDDVAAADHHLVDDTEADGPRVN